MPKMSAKERQARADIVLKCLIELYPNPGTILQFSNNWELVVAVAMSAQTTDKQVNVVTTDLFTIYKTLDDYRLADPDVFAQHINRIGLYKTKAKHIIAAANVLHDQFNGVLPRTVKELQTLPGVGRKTANVVLGYAYGLSEGIAVDTHVTRLVQKYKLTTYQDPKRIEQALMVLLPKTEWFHFTNRMVTYGREYSPAHKKHLTDDPISVALAKAGYKV